MKTIEVVAAIIHHDGKILATQRGYGDFKDGWEFPGGKMEAGRDSRACDRSRNRRRAPMWRSDPKSFSTPSNTTIRTSI